MREIPKNNFDFEKESFLHPISGDRMISIKPNYFTSYVKYGRAPKQPVAEWDQSIDGTVWRNTCECCGKILSMDERFSRNPVCNSCQNLSNNKHSGNLSNKSKSRLQLAFDWLYLLSKNKKAFNEKKKSWYNFKLALLTVKLPCKQLHDDLYIKKYLLNEFLSQLRIKEDLHMYIWRAEKEDNVILHFHILHDHYMEYGKVNRIWNKILDHHGYIDQYRKNQQAFHQDGFRYRPAMDESINAKTGKPQKKWSLSKQIKAYKKGIETNWSQPTGTTDIHSIRTVKNTKAYIAKYISKPSDIDAKTKQVIEIYKKNNNIEILDPESESIIKKTVVESFGITGNLWYISQPLSRLKSAITDVSDVLVKLFTKIQIESPSRIYISDWCQIFNFNIRDIINKNFTPLIDPLRTFISEVRSKFYASSENIFSALGIQLTLFDYDYAKS